MIDMALFIAELVGVGALSAVLGYFALLSVIALFSGKRRAFAAAPRRRYAVVVPAHDEEETIADAVESLKRLDYPGTMYDVVVVADNCTDATADRARALGALVLERTDPDNRGKGHALSWGFSELLKSGYDAFVVNDADSTMSRNYLRVMERYLDAGLEAVQSSDLVLPAHSSWSVETTRLGFLLCNYVRPLGRTRLGLSAGLRGNGMCFTSGLLRRMPWDAFGITEDLQYGLNLLLGGVKVGFAPEAVVLAKMPMAASNAVTQRNRWERGRSPIRKKYLKALFSAGVKQMSPSLFDAWLDLATPSFVMMMAFIAFMAVLHGALRLAGADAAGAWFGWWLLPLGLGLAHMAIGLPAAGADRKVYLAVLHIPSYVFWKMSVYAGWTGSGVDMEWIRTHREKTETYSIDSTNPS